MSMSGLNPIQKFRFEDLRNEEMLNIIQRLLEIFSRIAHPLLAPAILSLKGAYDTMVDALRQQLASVRTQQMNDTDTLRDLQYTDLLHGVKTGHANPSATVRDAAGQIRQVLDLYHDTRPLPVDQKTSRIREMLAELNKPGHAPALDQLPSCKTAASQLAMANEAYASLYDGRLKEMAEHHTVGATAAARLALNDESRSVITLINSHHNLLHDGSLETVIKDTNIVLDDARHLLHRLAAHRSGSSEVLECESSKVETPTPATPPEL